MTRRAKLGDGRTVGPSVQRHAATRFLVSAVLLALLSAIAAPAPAQRRGGPETGRVLRATLALVYDSRDMADYITDRYDVAMELRRGELRVHGTHDFRSTELLPSGPGRHTEWQRDVDETWTGRERREGGARIIDFESTTRTRPPTDPDLALRCSEERARVGGRTTSVVRCDFEPPPRWGREPAPYARVPIRFSARGVHNEVMLRYGDRPHVTLRAAR